MEIRSRRLESVLNIVRTEREIFARKGQGGPKVLQQGQGRTKDYGPILEIDRVDSLT
jgi:hypothetical protein